MSKNYQTKLLQRPVTPPNRLLSWAMRRVLRRQAKKNHTTYTYVGNVKDYQHQQVIMLAQHCSREEYVYTLPGFPKRDLHIVVGYQNFLSKSHYWLLPRIGAIPKYLYVPDSRSIKKMLQVIQRGASLLLYPEGIQATSGSTQPINPATVKLLLKCRLPVILCTSQGSYLTRPRYSKVPRYGHVNYRYEVLFTPEELATLDETSAYQKLLTAFRYNDFAFNRQARIPYRGKVPNITGLDNLIYRCPSCQSEFGFQIAHDTMTCQHCGLAVTMDEYYDLHANRPEFPFTDLDQWYQWQRRHVREQVAAPDFQLTVPVNIGTRNVQHLKPQPESVGTGTLTLTPTALIYQGSYQGQTTCLEFDLRLIPSLPLDPEQHNLDMIYRDQYYCFMPTDNPLRCVQLLLMVEELHNRLDPVWRQACEDVYDYHA